MVSGSGRRPQALPILRYLDHHWFGDTRLPSEPRTLAFPMAFSLAEILVVGNPESGGGTSSLCVLFVHRNSIAPFRSIVVQGLGGPEVV